VTKQRANEDTVGEDKLGEDGGDWCPATAKNAIDEGTDGWTRAAATHLLGECWVGRSSGAGDSSGGEIARHDGEDERVWRVAASVRRVVEGAGDSWSDEVERTVDERTDHWRPESCNKAPSASLQSLAAQRNNETGTATSPASKPLVTTSTTKWRSSSQAPHKSCSSGGTAGGDVDFVAIASNWSTSPWMSSPWSKPRPCAEAQSARSRKSKLPAFPPHEAPLSRGATVKEMAQCRGPCPAGCRHPRSA